MRYTRFLVALGLTVLTAQAPGGHVLVQPEDIQWRGPATGVQTSIAEGNPQTGGTFTMMLHLADGAWIQPHFHNVDKRLVVIKGELLMGHGDTIVALIANGPFTTTMVK